MNVECLEYINDGAYAEVWLAIDELNRAVAVKAMKPSGAGVSTLQQHADVLIRASHPNVVNVYSVDTVEIPNNPNATLVGNQDSIVMEFIEGITLDKYLIEKRTDKSLYKIGSQILDGLIYIHSQNLVHMDLHDNNIMVTESGQVKLIDIMYRNSLSQVTDEEKVKRIGFDISRLIDALERLIVKSKLGQQGKLEFNNLINGAESLEVIKNAFYDVFTFAHDRFRISGLFLSGNSIAKLRHYKFKAEHLNDVLEFIKYAGSAVKGYRIDSDMLTDVEVEFVSTETKQKLINMLDRSPESEIMIYTLEHIYDYSGTLP